MIGNFLLGVIYIAIVYVLVRPGTDWANVISDVSDSLANLTTAAIKGDIS